VASSNEQGDEHHPDRRDAQGKSRPLHIVDVENLRHHYAMTMDEMKVIVKTQMRQRKISESIIQMAVNVLPELKRWKNVAMAK
jgi:hypothetical protein